MKKIALFTAGGDAPGMNAAIRAIVRTALQHNLEVAGIQYGYRGMCENTFIPLDAHSVSNIIHTSGTMLKTSRYKEFESRLGREKGYAFLRENQIDGIVAIGGDGTFRGAHALGQESGIPIVGVPATIDNDVTGTDYTVGFDTAVNTALDAIDKIRNTAESHDRVFFVEVMGRHAGFLALEAGITGGAEAIMIPEEHDELDWLIKKLRSNWGRRKTSKIVVVAEGDEEGNAFKVAAKVKALIPDFDYRVSILGHIQRGGTPTARDRMIATLTGSEAVNTLLSGKSNIAIGIHRNELTEIPFETAFSMQKRIDLSMLNVNKLLSA